MGDRFYKAQLDALGTCPGYTGKRKQRKNMAWDDEKRAKVVAAYKAKNPTSDNSMEIVAEIAKEVGESVNGVRMILTKANVYVKKESAAGSKPAGEKKEGGARVSKEAAHSRLTAAINDIGAEVDDEIISKMTGKAAMYIAGLLETASKG